jgi:adenylate kinase
MLTKRIAGRRSCPKCGSVYNTELDPPQGDGVCDRDGNALVHREDDTAETVKHRLSVYHEATEPLIEYYEASKSPVHHVRSDQAVEVVQGEVRAALGLGV